MKTLSPAPPFNVNWSVHIKLRIAYIGLEIGVSILFLFAAEGIVILAYKLVILAYMLIIYNTLATGVLSN